MTIAAADFRSFVIQPALGALVPAGVPVSKVAADLLMATAAVESGLGSWLVQHGSGPAVGVFQIEPVTFDDLLLRLTDAQKRALATVATPQAPLVQMASNLTYAAAVCRLRYWLDPAPLPPDTKSGLWSYYKRIWNTAAGATTRDMFDASLDLTDLENLPE